jgi:sortase (surface protein transpeptidase)
MVSALAIAVLAFGFYLRGGGGPFGGGSSGSDLAERTIHNAPPNAETINDLDALRERFGDPPDATFGTMRIPAIGVEAPIGVRVVGEDGVMADPTGPSDVVWYDYSQHWEGFGGAPGEGRNAIFAAHVDRAAYLEYAGVKYVGPGAFFNLDGLDEGDEITVTIDGETFTYTVAWTTTAGTEQADWGLLLNDDTGGTDSITLVTCGGDFNNETHEYEERTIVRAVAS